MTTETHLNPSLTCLIRHGSVSSTGPRPGQPSFQHSRSDRRLVAPVGPTSPCPACPVGCWSWRCVCFSDDMYPQRQGDDGRSEKSQKERQRAGTDLPRPRAIIGWHTCARPAWLHLGERWGRKGGIEFGLGSVMGSRNSNLGWAIWPFCVVGPWSPKLYPRTTVNRRWDRLSNNCVKAKG